MLFYLNLIYIPIEAQLKSLKYFDVNVHLKYLLIQEIQKNVDQNSKSTMKTYVLNLYD